MIQAEIYHATDPPGVDGETPPMPWNHVASAGQAIFRRDPACSQACATVRLLYDWLDEMKSEVHARHRQPSLAPERHR
jgi:hypothetical protein